MIYGTSGKSASWSAHGALVILLSALAVGPLQAGARHTVTQRAAHIYYVSTTGRDSNSGLTVASPFQHIQTCASVMAPGDTCLIRGGTYRETIRPAHSGQVDAPLLFAPYKGEAVTISGADPVANWSHYQAHVFRARVDVRRPTLTSADNQVFVDHAMIPAAQWPAPGLDPMTPHQAVAAAGTGATRLCDRALSAFPAHFWKGALLHVWAGYGWWADTVFVKDSSPEGTCGAGSGSITFAPMPFNTGPGFDPLPGNPYYLEAATMAQASTAQMSGASTVPEYAVTGGYLYLMLPSDMVPRPGQVEIKQRDVAFDLTDRSYVTLGTTNHVGFTVFGATITTSARSTGDVLDGLSVTYPSHFATFTLSDGRTLTNGNDNQMSSGVLLAGSYDQLINSRIDLSAGNGVDVAGDHALVQNNLITRANYTGGSGTGISAQDAEYNGIGSYDAIVRHNTIHDVGGAGIAAPALGNVVTFNNIYHTGKFVNDVGSGFLSDFYFGPGCKLCGHSGLGGSGSMQALSLFAYNWVHDTLDPVARSAGFCPDPSQGNCAAAGIGIYLDISAGPWLVHHNVVWGESYADLILNGNEGDFGGVPGNQRNLVLNNTLASPNPLYGSLSALYRDDLMTGTVIMNNVTVAPMTFTVGTQPPTVTNNMTVNIGTDFVDPGAHDYRLRPSSPAVGKGGSIPTITTGQQDGHVDPGAYATSGGSPNQDWGPPGCNFEGCVNVGRGM